MYNLLRAMAIFLATCNTKQHYVLQLLPDIKILGLQAIFNHSLLTVQEQVTYT